MRIGYVRYYANPEEQSRLRQMNEARAAAIWTGIGAISEAVGRAVGGLARRYRIWAQSRETRRILLGLDDRMLRDIGMTRAEVNLFAEDAARLAPETGVTVGELRGLRAAAERAERFRRAEGGEAEALALRCVASNPEPRRVPAVRPARRSAA